MNAKLPSLVGFLSVFASPILAQASSPSTPAASYHWVAISAGFSMAIASAGCGLAESGTSTKQGISGRSDWTSYELPQPVKRDRIYGMTINGRIMSCSSCSNMWQCQT